MSEATITLESQDEAVVLFGHRDQHLREIRNAIGAQVVARGDTIIIKGTDEQIDRAQRVVGQLRGLVARQGSLSMEDVRTVLEVVMHGGDRIETAPTGSGATESLSRFVRPRTDGQSRYVRAMREHDMTLCVGPAGTGKCIVGDSLVLTGEGLIPIEELAAGTSPNEYRPQSNIVYGLEGKTQTSHVYNGGLSETIQIRTRQGFELEGTPEHPILTINEEGEVDWHSLSEVQRGTYIAIARGTNLFGHKTAVDFCYQAHPNDRSSRAVSLDRLDPEFAYFMGLMIGDGCLTWKGRVIFTSADAQLRETFEEILKRWNLHWFPNTDRPHDMVAVSHQLYALLMHLGLTSRKAHEKQVPHSILRAPRELVVAFLQGLFDTDGTVSLREGYPSLATASPRLAREVQLLLLNLGVVTRLRVKPTPKRPSHIVEACGKEADRFFEIVGFRLLRKALRARAETRNTNLDLVPGVAGLVDDVLRSQRLNRATHKTFYDYRINRRRPSYLTLSRLLERVQAPHASRERLSWLVDQNFLWSEVTSVKCGKGQVYDLTVPGSHSFVANGVVNHNTYLAVGVAVSMLRQAVVKKIVLVRPAVEAGERLGYLPGDLIAKVNPYLRPLFDALNDMMDHEQVKRYMENDIIEIVPLAYMRGRTLNQAAIILDEGQNTTISQMKMFLTRMGQGSKIIVTGDVTQIDLPPNLRSGLIDAVHRLRNIERIAIVYLDENDIVRHSLVQQVLRAYEDDKPRKKKE